MLTRRALLLSAGGTLLAQPRPKPNLVLFLSDDHGYFDSPLYGSKVVRTPNLEALAREGMVFEAAFTASPTCVPSRAILMSGLYPARNGALPNHSGLKPGIPTMPTFLKAAGYDIFHFGKSHFQPAANYPDWTHIPSEIRGGTLNNDLDVEAVERWMAERARTNSDRPVCLVICSHSPHVYWPPNDGYNPGEVELPPSHVDTPQTRSERTKYYTDIGLADKRLGAVMESCRKHLSANTLFIYASDNGAQWPFAKWSLYDAGIRLPFVARWPGVVRAGSRTAAMISYCDVMPTFLELAGAEIPPGIDGKSFAEVLFGKTQSHRSEIYAVHSGDGDFNVYPHRAVRTARFKYIRNLHPEFKYTTHIDVNLNADGRIYYDSWAEKAKTDPQAAAIVRRYHERPAEELYDVAADPHEMRNVASDPRHASTLRELRTKLDAWMRQQNDTGPVFGKPKLLAEAAAPAAPK